jgi:hypothetical protein
MQDLGVLHGTIRMRGAARRPEEKAMTQGL